MKKINKIISLLLAAVIVATSLWHAPPAMGALNIPLSFLAEEYLATPSEAIRPEGNATLSEATPPEATPSETTPPEATPSEATPSGATMSEATPSGATMSEATPIEATPIEAVEFNREKPDKELIPEYYTKVGRIYVFIDRFGKEQYRTFGRYESEDEPNWYECEADGEVNTASQWVDMDWEYWNQAPYLYEKGEFGVEAWENLSSTIMGRGGFYIVEAKEEINWDGSKYYYHLIENMGSQEQKNVLWGLIKNINQGDNDLKWWDFDTKSELASVQIKMSLLAAQTWSVTTTEPSGGAINYSLSITTDGDRYLEYGKAIRLSDVGNYTYILNGTTVNTQGTGNNYIVGLGLGESITLQRVRKTTGSVTSHTGTVRKLQVVTLYAVENQSQLDRRYTGKVYRGTGTVRVSNGTVVNIEVASGDWHPGTGVVYMLFKDSTMGVYANQWSSWQVFEHGHNYSFVYNGTQNGSWSMRKVSWVYDRGHQNAKKQTKEEWRVYSNWSGWVTWPEDGDDSGNKIGIRGPYDYFTLATDSVSVTYRTVDYDTGVQLASEVRQVTLEAIVRGSQLGTGNLTYGDRAYTYYSDTSASANDGAVVTRYIRKQSYQVIFQPNGGSGSASTQTYLFDTQYNTPTTGTRVGYTFKGWSTTSNGPVQYGTSVNNVLLRTSSASSATLYAVWEAHTYTITYNSNSGGGTTENSAHTYGTAKNLSSHGFTKPYHTFTGWNTAANGSGTNYANAQSVVNLTATHGATITLYAQWQRTSSMVDFIGHNGLLLKTEEVPMGGAATPPPAERQGYTLTGWDKPYTNVTDHSTLTAQYAANQYNQSIHLNGGYNVETGNSDDLSIIADYNTYQPEISDQYIFRRGYILSHVKDSSGNALNILSSELPGVTVDGNVRNVKAASFQLPGNMPASNNTYQMEWKPLKVPFRFSDNLKEIYQDFYKTEDSILETATITYQDDVSNGALTWGELYQLPAPASPGLQFKDWYTKTADGQVHEISNGSPVDYRLFYQESLEGGNLSFDAETKSFGRTILARWEFVPYDITFYDQIPESTWNLTRSRKYHEPIGGLPILDRDGFAFKGWYTAPTGGESIESSSHETPLDGLYLYAKWVPKQFTITFHDNLKHVYRTIKPDEKGSVIERQEGTYGVDSSGGFLPYGNLVERNSELNGLVFTGWWTTADECGVKITPASLVEWANVKDGQTLYAHYDYIDYPVTFVSEEGDQPETIKVFKRFKEELRELPIPLRTGYSFMGWFTSSSENGEKISSTTRVPLGGAAYYARWTVNHYQVTWDYNHVLWTDGNVAEEYAYDTNLNLPEEPHIDGYTFKGWYRNREFTGEALTGASSVEARDVTYYARWKAKIYTMKFYSNYYKEDSSEPQTMDRVYDTKLGVLPEVSQDGYEFKGWFTFPKGGIKIGSETDVPLNGANYYAQWAGKTFRLFLNDNLSATYTGIKELTDQIKDYTLEYKTDQATGGCLSYKDFMSLPASTPVALIFKGWYTDRTGGEEVTDDSRLTWADAENGITLYAQYEFIQYDVLFDDCIPGGSDPLKISRKYMEKLGTLPEPDRTGYTFRGWYTEQIGGMQVGEATEIPLNGATFYAHWEANHYEITYDVNHPEWREGNQVRSYVFDTQIGIMPKPEIPGYQHRGWFKATTSDAARVEPTDMVEPDDMTYYSQWSARSYQLKFYSQESEVKVPTKSVEYDKTVGELEAPGNLEDFEFIGWYAQAYSESEDNPAHEEKLYADSAYPKESKRLNPDTLYRIAGDLNVYAYFKLIFEDAGNNMNRRPGPDRILGTADDNYYLNGPDDLPGTKDDYKKVPESEESNHVSSKPPEVQDDGGFFIVDQENPYHVFYQKPDGSFAKSEWIGDGTYWYHANESGLIDHDWLLEGNAWYKLNGELGDHFGAAKIGWFQEPMDGKTYFFDIHTAEMKIGWQLIDNKWYYFTKQNHGPTYFGSNTTGWRYDPTKPGNPFGSMYRNERTPDGYLVDKRGIWRKE